MIPSNDDLVELGYVTRLHGYKGELTIFLNAASQADYNHLSTLYLETKNEMVPYTIESIGTKTNKAMKLKLEGIDSEEAAKQLVKSKIFIAREDLSEQDETRLALRSINGFRVKDVNRGEIGTVSGVLELPANPQLQIQYNGVTILLPLREEFIRKIDRKKREVEIEEPEGLIDLYLE
ncbi:MAG: 16S rRNA processing protein RimM [Crocinitomicaceae bacterium]|nr:16S rRNA processing protein RimM [Crocinitomicaceae bacterium]